MNIGLVDVDGKNFPNIALMKLSAYHKSIGDNVCFVEPLFGRYDKVYLSKVFSFTKDYDTCINADDIVKGGTGYAFEYTDREVFKQEKDTPLKNEIEHIMPDYSLYGINDTAYGFLTRGCPRNCQFCIVGKKEGLCSKKVAELEEFWNGQKNIVLCDPNLLACKDREILLQQLAETKANVDFNQGLDARFMTIEIAKLLGQIKIKEIHFEWDNMRDSDKILKGLEIYSKYCTKKPHNHNSIVYTLVNFDTTFEEDLHRIYTLRKLGYWAYVMIYDKDHCDAIYKKLQRWVNNRFIFAKCLRFEDYKNYGN